MFTVNDARMRTISRARRSVIVTPGVLCFKEKTGTDGKGRSKKLQDGRRTQTPFFPAKHQQWFAKN
jgi:hypothetical protein